MAFAKIDITELKDNFFNRIGDDWMLLTAGPPEHCNTMTISWGQVGVVWSRPVISVYLSQGHLTEEYLQQEERFSVCFFEPGTHKDEMNFLGTQSGRNGDKIAKSGLSLTNVGGVAAFEEAQMVFICHKLYRQHFVKEGFYDEDILEVHYPDDDNYHAMYVGEIEQVYIKKA